MRPLVQALTLLADTRPCMVHIAIIVDYPLLVYCLEPRAFFQEAVSSHLVWSRPCGLPAAICNAVQFLVSSWSVQCLVCRPQRAEYLRRMYRVSSVCVPCTPCPGGCLAIPAPTDGTVSSARHAADSTRQLQTLNSILLQT